MNEDYIKGMKILLKYSHESGINIRNYTWIPLFSKYLSNEGLCEKFWANAKNQDIIYKITRLKFYFPHKHRRSLGGLIDTLLTWTRTNEGEVFWHDVYKKYKNDPILII